jgi:outer membrane protein assembly factor BamB
LKDDITAAFILKEGFFMHVLQHTRARTALSLLAVVSIVYLALFGTVSTLRSARAASVSAIKLSPASGPPTTAVGISGTGFGVNESVTITFDGVGVDQANTSATGDFSSTFFISQSTAPGAYVVQATGQTSGDTAKARFFVRTNWLSYDGNITTTNIPDTRFNQYENTINAANVSQLKVFWTASTTGIISSSPAIVNGVAYIGGQDGFVYAVNATTGAIIWTAATANHVYIEDQGGTLYAFDALTGALKGENAQIGNDNHNGISTATGSGFSPVINSGKVYVTADSTIYVFNADLSNVVTQAIAGAYFSHASAIVNGILYVTSSDSKIHAFKAAGCASPPCTDIWHTATTGSIYTTPSVGNGVVYAGGIDGKLYVLKASNGAYLWTAVTGGPIRSAAAVANGVVYVESEDGNLYAFNANGCGNSTCQPIWKASTGPLTISPPSDFDPDFLSSPMVANGVVYIGSGDSKIYAFDAVTGNQLFVFQTGGPIRSSPVVVNGVAYIGSYDGKLYAFHL